MHTLRTFFFPERRPDCRRGFTLIELLTVIAIIGILAAIIIPVVGKVRQAAKGAQGVSNLRQISLAAITYAEANRGALPFYEDSQRSPRTKIAEYIANDKWSRIDVFRDPLGTFPDKGFMHFTGNPNAFRHPDPGVPTRTVTMFNSSSVMFFDGVQIEAWGGEVESFGWRLDNGRLNNTGLMPYFNKTEPERPIAPGDNTDSTGNSANVRWRMPGDKAKFSFFDGRVQVLAQDQVLRRMFFAYPDK